MTNAPPIFVVRLCPAQAGDGGYRQLKQFLKCALRQFQLRAISIYEERRQIQVPLPFAESDDETSAPATEWRAGREVNHERRKETERKMDMRKFAGENFVKTDDVRNGPLQVTIAVIKEGQYDKPNLVFETGEILGLNATNSRILLRAYGPNSDDWVGKQIELYLGEVEYQKKMQPAVLVRPLSPVIAAADKTAAAKKLGDETEDSLPF